MSSSRESDAIRRNDKTLTEVQIEYDFNNNDEIIDVLGALKNNTVVNWVGFFSSDNLLLVNQEMLLKLSEAMKCNKSVESLFVYLQRGLLRERLFASMATSGGWSSIQELTLDSSLRAPDDDEDDFEPLSLREAEHLSSFILQCENFRTLRLEITGDEAVPIVEILARTKVQSLHIRFDFVSSTLSLQNGGRRLATGLERCICITELQVEFPSNNEQVEFFHILLLESIPKMLGLKKLKLIIYASFNQQFFDQFFDTVGQCIGGHQGEIQELTISVRQFSVNSSSIVGLVPALRRLKVIGFPNFTALTSKQIRELSAVVADCDTLEEFGYNLANFVVQISDDDFKAICQLLSRFPSLKRVTTNRHEHVDLREEGRFTAFLEMIKTSKTIEQVPPFKCNNAEEEATIKHHCQNNMIHNQIRENGLLAATVPSSAWPLILKKFSDMPDVLYYLLQQKHGAMIGPTRDGCKRKQNFD